MIGIRPAMPRALIVFVAIAALLLPACATLQEFAALRRVAFAYDRVDNVRLATVRLDDRRSYSDLEATEIARLAAAVLARQAPLDIVIHVAAENPADNKVSARLTDLAWKLFIDDRETVSGKLAGTYLLPPGEKVDVPIAAQLDLYELFGGNARDLVELALAIAGHGTTSKELRLEATPTIQTSVGPITYPSPIVIRRAPR